MVIKALVKLYERLLAQKLVAPEGWDKQKIGYKVVIGTDGSLKDIVSVKETVVRKKAEKQVPRTIMLPKAVVRTQGITANFLWDNAKYVFGYLPDNPERGLDCFKAFRAKAHDVLDGATSKEALAILRFVDTYDPEELSSHPVFVANEEALNDPTNFVFCLEGGTISDMSESPDIQKAWAEYLEREGRKDAILGICCETAKTDQIIARVHPKIKGITGADSSGAALVCFNVPSVCSYNGDGQQSANSHISAYAAAAYAKALNYLLSDTSHRTSLGNVTVVYWSESNTPEYGKCFDTLLDGNLNGKTSYSLDSIMGSVWKGKSFMFDEKELNPHESFYVLGFGSSGSRASVRFFWKDSFGGIVENLYKHQERLLVSRPEKVKSIPAYLLLKTAASPGSEIPSPVIDVLFNSILNDTPYPPPLFLNMVGRVLMDRDDKAKGTQKISYVKAGMIKAYLVKNCYERWKELTAVALNEKCEKTPYLLGRLFALLEGIQRQALPNINTTIKDRFFNSACMTPEIAFPVLIRLAQTHMKKLSKPLAIYFDKKLTTMLDRITLVGEKDSFPKRLSPEEQGAFILGYYQERQSVFTKKKEEVANKAE